MASTCQCLFAPKLDKKVFKVSIESNLNGNNWLCKLYNFQQCFNQEIWLVLRNCTLHMLHINFVLQKSNCTIVNLHLVQRSQLLHIITKVTNKTLYRLIFLPYMQVLSLVAIDEKKKNPKILILSFFLGYFFPTYLRVKSCVACVAATLNTPNPVLWVKWNSWLVHVMTK